MSFGAEKKYFVKDGKPYFLISGEIHYFRINPRFWEKHLKLLKESGANATSTYVPWDWHEYKEGKFDFTGLTNPGRNLIKYINLCKKIGLDLIVKPGPYILAEYKNQGLPEWLKDKVGKDVHTLDENGNMISQDLMSYMSDEFLHYTFLWYDKIMPIIALHQHSNAGPVIMMQVCNEVGVFQWLSGKIDYNPSIQKLYKKFIEEKYKSLSQLNRIYGTKYSSFDQLKPPFGKIENKQHYCAYYDFHLFYRHYYALYLDTLIERIKSYGVDLQFTHNVPGWIYGQASELPMLISTYEEVMRTRNDIIFGLDHIPEFFSFRNAHSDLACNKILEAMQPDSPVWAAEFQCGSREHHVKSYAKDLESFYIASLAHDMKSFNYYMFSSGINPEGKGHLGKSFYFQTALDDKANKSELYDSIKKVNRFIKKEKENLLLSEIKSEICVGLYKPYFYTELTTSQMLKEKRLDVVKLGLLYDPRFVREEIFFNGLLRALQTLNFSYDIKDLERISIEELLGYKQLWITTTEFMDDATQQLLVEYVKAGGHLIIYPAIPVLDLYLNECAILKKEMNVYLSKSISPNLVSVLGIKELFTSFKEKFIFQSEEESAIAKTETGEICGIHKKVGNGFLTALGFAFGYTTDDHLHLFERIILLNKIKRQAKIFCDDIQFVIRKSKRFTYLFLLNYHNERKTIKVNSKNYVLNPFSYKIINIKK